MLTFKFSLGNQNNLVLKRETALHYGLISSKIYRLNLGYFRGFITIDYDDIPSHDALLTLINIPFQLDFPVKLNIRVCDNDIFLGPVMGICISEKYKSLLLTHKSSSTVKDLGLKEMMEYSRKYGILLYYFTEKGFYVPTQSMQGLIKHPDKNVWKIRHLPLPDVIYDRAYHQTKTQFSARAKLLSMLVYDYGAVKINNPRIISKKIFYNVLSKYPYLQQYLPETIVSNNYENILAMFSRHDTIVTKPVVGYSSINILFICNKGKLEITYMHKSKVKTRRFSSENKLLHFIKDYYKNEKIIIQQGIDKLTYKGRALTLRLFMQKGIDGKWNCTDNAVCLGTKGNPFTNTRHGGKNDYFDNIMPRVLKSKEHKLDNLKNNLHDIAISTVKCLDAYYGSFGELGVDIGLDNDLNIWLFEANAMAWKEVENLASIMAAQHSRPLEYAMYLAGFKNKD